MGSSSRLPTSTSLNSIYHLLNRVCNMKQQQQQQMQLPKGIFLAPMVRASELAFRVLSRRYGNASLCYSPMLRDHDVISVATSTDNFLTKDFEVKTDLAGRTCSKEETAYLMLHDAHQSDTANLVVQLCGSCPEKLGRATNGVLDIYSKNNGMLPSGIDLNLGCPQECAMKDNFGAFLVENDSNAAVSCISSMRNAIDNHPSCKAANNNKPALSAKIRLLKSGIDDTIQFARKLQFAGVDYIAIHCRHRSDKHEGEADWDAGGKVVSALSDLPIILNGGVSNWKDATQVMEKTGCHAVMAATGYLRNHRLYNESSTKDCMEPQYLALEYLELAEKYPPPSYLYIQKHLRWIFRDTLQPEDDPDFDKKNWSDWRVKLWNFLVRPYLRNIEQFRLFVALYVKLSGGEERDKVPESICHLVQSVSFGSVKKAGKRKREI